MKTLLFILSAIALLTQPLTAQDSVPKLINYQGRLTDVAGANLSTGSYKVRFTLHSKKDSAQPGDALVWGSDYTVSVLDGLFNVVLGAGGGINVPGAGVIDIGFAFGAPERYLQMEILTSAGGSQSPPQIILPRQQLLSAPYAITAAGAVPVGGVIMWWGDKAAIPPDFEICNGAVPTTPNARLVGNKPDLQDRFVKGALSSDATRADLGTGGAHTISDRSSASVALTEAQIPDHSHGYADRFWIVNGSAGNNSFGYKISAGSLAANARGPDGSSFPRDTYWATNATTVGTGGSQGHSHTVPTHDNRPAFLEMYFIIRVK